MTKKPCVHRPDMTGFRFTVCKKGHTAMSQRNCLDCGKPFCVECQAAAQQDSANEGAK